MNLKKATKRDNRLMKRKHGHREDGRTVFLIKKMQKERARKIKRQREIKDSLRESD